MSRENLTFGDAINRVNELVKFYSSEKTRLEDNLTKLLLPAGLTFTAGMLKDAIDPKYVSAAIFLVVFFVIYALLIYCDLYVAERAYLRAFNLQDKLYEYENVDASSGLDVVVSAQVLALYNSAESRVGTRATIPPTAKPLISLIGGLVAAIVHRSL